jgi:hypothetical protein
MTEFIHSDRETPIARRPGWNAVAGWLFVAWIVFVTSYYLYCMLRSFIRP